MNLELFTLFFLILILIIADARRNAETIRRLSRDDFILSEPDNASLYFDFSSLQKEKQLASEKANVTQNSARNSRELDLDHFLGSPRKVREGIRESRILNHDEKKSGLSIQGFIPIVSLPANQQANTNNRPVQLSYSPSSSYNKPQYEYAGPNDAKFLGTALQSLTSAFQKPKRQFTGEFDGYSNSYSQNCVCVPFYMCKNGYIEQRSKKSSTYPNTDFQKELSLALATLNAYPTSSTLSSSLEHQENFQPNKQAIYQTFSPEQKNKIYSYLPIDERSIDGQDKNQTDDNSQYTSEVLGRIFGSSPYSDQSSCGMLRTCCKVYPKPYPYYEVATSPPPNSPYSYQPSEIFQMNSPYMTSFYGSPNKPQSNGAYLQPFRRKPSKIGFDVTASLFKPKYPALIGILGRPHLPYSANYVPSYSSRPSRLSVPNYQSLHQTYPASISSYQYPRPSYSSSASNLQSHNLHDLTNYDQKRCGIRNAAGVQGRVQNLEHDSSSTEFGEYPWQVAILKRLGPVDSLYVCGGTLISNFWVATAAHCIKNNKAQDLKVRLGEWDVHREDEFYPHVEKYVQEVIIHPEFYPGNLDNDLALLKLESPVDINLPHISPACVPEEYENFAGHRCWVTGWGKDAFGSIGSYKSTLKKVDLPILGHDECEKILQQTRLGPYYQLHHGFLCAGGEPRKDACEGDGGGPLVCEVNGIWKVAGLVSWGIGCGNPGIPGVYVNMAYYNQWIDNVIGKFSKHSEEEQQNLFSAEVISERSNQFNLNGTAEQSKSMGIEQFKISNFTSPVNSTEASPTTT